MKPLTKTLTLAAAGLALAGCEKTCPTSNEGEANAPQEAYVNPTYDVTPKEVKTIQWSRKSIAFIVDTSGSMRDRIEGERKIGLAKDALKHILGAYSKHNNSNNDLEAALFCFDGNDGVKKVVGLQKFDYGLLSSKVNDLTADANTPPGKSLAAAERELDAKATGRKYIVMLTDGENNEGWSPEKVFKLINESNEKTGDNKTQLYVIAFNTSKNKFKPLEGLGATVYEAKDGAALLETLVQNAELILEKPLDY